MLIKLLDAKGNQVCEKDIDFNEGKEERMKQRRLVYKKVRTNK